MSASHEEGGVVKEKKKNGKPLYICEECGFAYEQKEWAEKCQRWCEQHHSCNLEITRHSGLSK